MLSINLADWRTELLACELLEALEVRLGFICFALSAQRTCQSKLGRDVHWIEFHRAAKFLLCFRVFLLLRVNVAEEVVSVGVVRSELRSPSEVCDRLLGLAIIAMQQAKIVWNRGILRIELGCAL